MVCAAGRLVDHCRCTVGARRGYRSAPGDVDLYGMAACSLPSTVLCGAAHVSLCNRPLHRRPRQAGRRRLEAAAEGAVMARDGSARTEHRPLVRAPARLVSESGAARRSEHPNCRHWLTTVAPESVTARSTWRARRRGLFLYREELLSSRLRPQGTDAAIQAAMNLTAAAAVCHRCLR